MRNNTVSLAPVQQSKIGIVLLAAGDSSRLGEPKQLLVHEGESLLQHSLNVATAVQAGPVILVLGAEAAIIRESTDSLSANVVINGDWQEGMASSIRCGIAALQTIDPAAEGVILMVCDQPFVRPALLQELISTQQTTRKLIVASRYAETFGPPVFFHQTLFPELLQLRGDVGARSVIRKHFPDVETIDFAKGTVDVDTKSDYQKLTGKSE